jgi:hypothetical protein
VAKLVWRVKLVAEFGARETTEVEVARLERDEHASLADLGLRLAEAKQITAALQAEIVPAQVTVASEHRRTCVACEGELASKGHYTATFRSLFGDVPIRPELVWGFPCQAPFGGTCSIVGGGRMLPGPCLINHGRSLGAARFRREHHSSAEAGCGGPLACGV